MVLKLEQESEIDSRLPLPIGLSGLEPGAGFEPALLPLSEPEPTA